MSDLYNERLMQIILSDPTRSAIAEAVGRLPLEDCWVAAGFVRNIVWDKLHSRIGVTPLNDIDVIYFDRNSFSRPAEKHVEEKLSAQFPGESFSVKNQARMHIHNKQAPYTSSADAMGHWPETCTAVGVAVRDKFEVAAPFGLQDLFSLAIRPTSGDDVIRALVQQRTASKGWLSLWPQLHIEPPR